MTGKLAEKLPLTMSSLINTIPDSLYPEEDIPTSMNIFTNTESISHYSQMNSDNIMDLGMGSEKAAAEIQYGSSFQSNRSAQTVTYLGKFAFDTPPSGGIGGSGWCSDNNIISLVSAGILGVSPSPGTVTTQTSSAAGQPAWVDRRQTWSRCTGRRYLPTPPAVTCTRTRSPSTTALPPAQP
ncbi:early growth response protein 3 [Takifugu flavidus]|uniref:early growth response protein 3 n=1 Tax=Takifugu flavidus TaxID=433684 RepID=UPI00254420BF|nr:early growth response protein 3 [Takifugu flavidus]